MAKVQFWEVSDKFWEKIEPLIPLPERDPTKTYKRKRGAAESQCQHGKYLKPFFLCCEPVANGRRCPKSDLAAPVPSTRIFLAGSGKGFSLFRGVRALQNMAAAIIAFRKANVIYG